MAVKFLDNTGLGYFWSKIKAWCNATFAAITHNQASNTINAMTGYSKPNSGSAIAASDSLNNAIGKLEAKVDAVDQSNIVHKTGTELIQGDKTFKPDGEGDSVNGSVALVLRNRYFDRTSANNPSRNNWTTLIFGDSQNELWTKNEYNAFTGRLGAVECHTDSLTGAAWIRLCCHKGLYSPGIDEEIMSCLYVGVYYDGTKYATCPTPPSSSNTNTIATTEWVNAKGYLTSHQSLANYVTLNSAQTISAVKTFTAAPVVSMSQPIAVMSLSGATKKTNPSSNLYGNINFQDKTTTVNMSKRAASLDGGVNTAGQTELSLRAFDWSKEDNTNGAISIYYPSGGTPYTAAPTPATADNSTKIATTAFVKAQGYITGSGNITGSSGSCTGNAATATKLATARTISLSGAVTGSVDFDGSSNSEISTVWRSCIVGHGDNNPNGQNWFKVATFTADAIYLDYSITFYVEDTYYNAHQGILKIHFRTNQNKILETNREHDTYLTWLTHTDYPLSDFVLVCPTTASPTLELWTRISGQYVGRRFVVLSEGNRARATTQWDLVGSINVRESSITSTGTQVESSENTYYVNNRKQQDIAGFKTFWNDLTLRGANILKYDNTSFLLLSSGHGFSRENGAHINLYGAEYSSGAGSFVLYTGHATQTTCPALFGWPSGSLQWNGQSIQTSSDERLKTSLTTVADEILDIWEDIQWGQFQFLDAVEEKGQNARLHLGFIAQHVKSVFEAHNIDICKFGILCHEIREATEFEPAFEQWMARYTEALCMEVIYQRRKNKILENHISELEKRLTKLEGTM